MLVARDRLDQRALLERVVHERAHAAEDRPRRSTGPARRRVRRSARGSPCRHGTHAVIRVVVAEAEEDEEVEVARVRLDVRRSALGLVGPSASSHVSSSRSECGAANTRSDMPPELGRIALAVDGKAPHRDAVDDLGAGGERVAPRDVVGRARRQHLDLDVPWRDARRCTARAARRRR